MLNRTTVLLPPTLKSRAVRAAAEKGVSFGELVRIALELHLMKKQIPNAPDAFLDDHVFYEGVMPADAAKNHDEYLYGK